MDFSDELTNFFYQHLVWIQRSMILRFFLELCWCLLHLPVSIVHIWSHLIQVLLSYLISSGLLKRYRDLQLHRLQYLAVVVDSEEAKNKTQIRQLLCWLSDIGVKYVILYDMEGVLKKSMGSDPISLTDSRTGSCLDANAEAKTEFTYQGRMAIELLSLSDGKEGTAKAASFLCSKYLKENGTTGCNGIEPFFTEADIADALKVVGCGGPDPDLLLVYGPARCHLGFPAWRIRYTEILHMGPLKLMRHGSIVKAIYDFSKKHQNYGS